MSRKYNDRFGVTSEELEGMENYPIYTPAEPKPKKAEETKDVKTA